MIPESSDLHIAERYLDLLGGGVQGRQALLACSAALRLDDEIARDAIELVAQTNGSTYSIVGKIKRLGCVWRQLDGTWYLTQEIRTYLADRLESEVPASVRQRLRELLAERIDRRLRELTPDGPLADYRVRTRKIEACYQKILIAGRAEEGGRDLGNLWRTSKGEARNATADAVAHLAPELEARVQRLPDEVLFLRGMTAYHRGDRRRAERDFRAVYKNGRPGEIYGIASHLYGNLVREPNIAEQAFRDSIRWYSAPHHQGQVWHSLGNLLSKGDRWTEQGDRWAEAESAYQVSLRQLSNPEDLAHVWLSLGQLHTRLENLAKAEEAYKYSFELDPDPKGKGQVRASWADALMKLGGPGAYSQIEAYALESRQLDPDNPKTIGIANRVLAGVYENQGDLGKAIECLEALQDTNRRLKNEKYQMKIQQRIDRLRTRIDSASKSNA